MHTRSVGQGSSRQLKLVRFVVAASATGLVACIILFVIYFTVRNSSRLPESRVVAVSSTFAPAVPNLWVNAVATGSGRPVYAYSVIPGGVASAQELSRASLRDPIVAAHYADFRVRSAHLIRLLRERRVYLSYRVGNQVYWTKKQVTLHAGEPVLSDGANFARARCGNRISEVPRQPVRPSEPPADMLDKPVYPMPPALTTDLASPPVWGDNSTPFLVAMETRPASPGTDYPFWAPFFFPPVGPRPPMVGSKPLPVSPTPLPGRWPAPLPVGPPPSVATPEPSTLLQTAIGLAAVLLVIKLRR